LNNTYHITLAEAGKKFGNEWIFRKLNLEIHHSEKIAILGLNGSGKSTLLQALSGFLSLNEGEISYYQNEKKIDEERMYQFCSYASPYLELIEDFTLFELINHHKIYKPFINGLTHVEIIELSGLKEHQHKYIHQFSSGMKQRLKLTLALLADVPILLLDEPTSNLDKASIEWFHFLIDDYAKHKIIIVCSNSISEEYSFCSKTIYMQDFKFIKKYLK
jgi:ABC-type multidrug transport system ATPase subunit